MARQFLGSASSRTNDSVTLSDVNGAFNAPAHVALRKKRWYADLSTYNWKASNTRKLREDIRRSRAGGTASHWTVLGDSLSSGYVGGGSLTGYDVLGTWPRTLRDTLENNFGVIVGGTGTVPAGQWPQNETTDWWPLGSQWTFTGTYDNLGDYLSVGGATTGTATYVPDQAGTQVDVFYSNAGGAFTWTIDGVAQTAPTVTGASTVAKITVTGLSNIRHTIVITRTSPGTPSYLIGIMVGNPSFGLHVHNLSVQGGRADFWANQSNIGFAAVNRQAALDLVGATITRVLFIEIGGNDIIAGRTKAQVTTDIVAMRNKARFAGADVVLLLEHAVPTLTTQQQTDLINAVYDAADQLDCPLIDMYDRHSTPAQMLADGLVIAADSLHYTAAGQRMAGQHIAEVLMSFADAPPEPVTASGPYPVRTMANSNVTKSGRQTIDGVVCVSGDPVLLTGQTTGSENGVWVVKDGAWERHPVFFTAVQCAGAQVRIQQGAAFAGQTWGTGFRATDVLDTTTMYWAPRLSTLSSRLTSAPTSTVVTFAGTGLSVNVEAGKTYKIQCRGQYRTAATTTGIALRIGGTATATGIRYETTIFGLTTSTYTHLTASTMGAAQAASTGVQAANTDYGFTVEGEIRVNAAGTLTLDFASEVAASTVTVQADSTLQLEEMP